MHLKPFVFAVLVEKTLEWNYPPLSNGSIVFSSVSSLSAWYIFVQYFIVGRYKSNERTFISVFDKFRQSIFKMTN